MVAKRVPGELCNCDVVILHLTKAVLTIICLPLIDLYSASVYCGGPRQM